MFHFSTTQNIGESLKSSSFVEVEVKALQKNAFCMLGNSFGDDAAWIHSDSIVEIGYLFAAGRSFANQHLIQDNA